MKRFVKVFMGALLSLTCLFAVVGCGGKDGGGNNAAMSEEEWSASIVDTGFIVETGGYIAVKSDGASYETYQLSGDSAYLEKTYLNGTYEITKEGGAWQPMKPIDQTAYQYNVQGFKGIISFVKNNRDAFTYSDSKYTMDLDGETLTAELENVKTVLEKTYIKPVGLQVESCVKKLSTQDRKYATITILTEKGGPNNIVITLRSPILQYEMEKKTAELTNFSIIGGPSRDDIDYIETYFTADGFRIYSPNNPDPLRRDAYLRYDSAADKYYAYRQNGQGDWYMEESSASIYSSTKNETYAMYLGNILEQGEKLVCDYDVNRCYNREVITKTNAMGTWSYFDIEFPISNTFIISSGAKWKMQLKQGQVQSLVYNITLEVGSVTLEYPQV